MLGKFDIGCRVVKIEVLRPEDDAVEFAVEIDLMSKQAMIDGQL